jgi:TnpA family transposase
MPVGVRETRTIGFQRAGMRFGKGGDFAMNQPEEREISMLALLLLQVCLVYINTLMIHAVKTGLVKPRLANPRQRRMRRELFTGI